MKRKYTTGRQYKKQKSKSNITGVAKPKIPRRAQDPIEPKTMLMNGRTGAWRMVQS